MVSLLVDILVIGNTPEDARLYERLLSGDSDHEYRLQTVETATDGFNILRAQKVDCILIDDHLPDMDGVAVLGVLAQDSRQCSIPVIFLTNPGNEMVAVEAMKNGATDSLAKHLLNRELMIRSVLYAVEKKQMEQRLHENVMELKSANQRILQQQQAVVEEERLKVLLQMAGATAHELNQPLMALLGNIELISLNRDIPESLALQIKKVEEAGEKIAEIVKKIQTIRHDQTTEYAKGISIIKVNQSLAILSVEEGGEIARQLTEALRHWKECTVLDAENASEAYRILEGASVDLVFFDERGSSKTCLQFLSSIPPKAQHIPVVIVGDGNERDAERSIRFGAHDYLPRSRIGKSSLTRVIKNAMDKSRLKQQVSLASAQKEETGTRDELTGLFSWKYLSESILVEAARAKRYGTPLSLVVSVLDRLQAIRDGYGRDAADRLIKNAAEHLRQCLRQSDIPCRSKGDEFVIILPNTEPEDGAILCNRFSKLQQEKRFEIQDIPVCAPVRIGLASFSVEDGVDTADKLMEKAFEALKGDA